MSLDLSEAELIRMPGKDGAYPNWEAEFLLRPWLLEHQTALLDWFDSICRQGMTIGMLRKAIHNKRVELTGNGEKA